MEAETSTWLLNSLQPQTLESKSWQTSIKIKKLNNGQRWTQILSQQLHQIQMDLHNRKNDPSLWLVSEIHSLYMWNPPNKARCAVPSMCCSSGFGTWLQVSWSNPSSFRGIARRIHKGSKAPAPGLWSSMITSDTASGFPTMQLLLFYFHLRN